MSKPWSANRVFRFVFVEMLRLQAELKAGAAREWSFLDAFAFIQDPKRGVRHIGIAAEKRLQELASLTITKRPDLAGRLQVTDLVRHFKKELANAIHDPQPKAPQQIVEDSVSSAKASVLTDTTFYIPCLLPRHSTIKRFRVGPIQFHDKERLFAAGFDFPDVGREQWQSFKEEKHRYNWFAQVTIEGFSKELARDRAQLFVRLAIAGIKLSFRDQSSKWFGTDQQLIPSHQETLLSQARGQRPSLSMQRRFFLNANDDQIAHLFAAGYSNWLKCLGDFLDHYIALGEFGFLGNRMITALTWFDTGCSPIGDAQKIIAYSNCLEALFITDDKGKKDQLLSRSTPFLEIVDQDPQWSLRVGEFYSIRSQLVHGQSSPLDPSHRLHVEFGNRICSILLQAMLSFCIWLLVKYPVATTPRHQSLFNGRGSFEKAFSHIDEYIQQFGVEKTPVP